MNFSRYYRAHLSLVLLLFGCFIVAATEASAQRTQSPVPLPVPFTPIVDHANVIDADTRQRLEAIFVNLKERADIEFAVLVVPTTGDLDIFDYSLAVARGWGIGSKEGEKNGFLLVVAVGDRKYFTQISDHLEADLPDGVVGQIQRERLVPQFRRGDYSRGIYDTVQAYVATLGEKRGFSIEGIDRNYAYRGTTDRPVTRRTGGNLSGPCCTILFILIIIIVLLSASRRGGRGGGGGGLLGWILLSSLLSSGNRGSWGGSSSGWSGGGFGGSGGGFGGGFGGGGSFGGGGAGGSW